MSVQRGIGPPKQSQPLPFRKLLAMKFGVEPLVAGGPINTRAVIIMFTFWLVRDIEGCLALFQDMRLDREALTVTWRLSVSKADPRALGCERQ